MRLSATLFIFGLASITCAAPQPMDTRAYANALDTGDAKRRIRSLTVPSIHARNQVLEVYYRKDANNRQPTDADAVRSEKALKDFLGHKNVRQRLGIPEDIVIEVKGEFYGFLKYSESGRALSQRSQKVGFTFQADSSSRCHPTCTGTLEIKSLKGIVHNEEEEIFKNF